MDSLALILLAVFGIGTLAVFVYVVRLVLRLTEAHVQTARQMTSEAVRMAETNTEALSRAVKESVEGIVTAMGQNSQGPPLGTVEQPLEGPVWANTMTGGPDGVPWADWTTDDIPDEDRPLIEAVDTLDEAVPGIPRPDLSGERL